MKINLRFESDDTTRSIEKVHVIIMGNIIKKEYQIDQGNLLWGASVQRDRLAYRLKAPSIPSSIVLPVSNAAALSYAYRETVFSALSCPQIS